MEKNKKKWYKNWWMIIIYVIISFNFLSLLFIGEPTEQYKKNNIDLENKKLEEIKNDIDEDNKNCLYLENDCLSREEMVLFLSENYTVNETYLGLEGNHKINENINYLITIKDRKIENVVFTYILTQNINELGISLNEIVNLLDFFNFQSSDKKDFTFKDNFIIEEVKNNNKYIIENNKNFNIFSIKIEKN